MSTTIDLTVGDTGVTIAGTFTQRQIGALADLAGCSLKFSLLRVGGGTPIVNEATATLGVLDAAKNSVAVSYRLQAADVAAAIKQAFVRWTFILPDGGKIHAPGPQDEQTIIRINP